MTQIGEAIKQKRLLRFNYHGHERVVEPHTYGLDLKGQEALCAYQVGGSSASGQLRGWKTFNVTDLQGLTQLDETFRTPRPEYKKNDGGFQAIFAEL